MGKVQEFFECFVYVLNSASAYMAFVIEEDTIDFFGYFAHCHQTNILLKII